MLDPLSSIPRRMTEWVGTLSLPLLGLVGVLILAGVAAGGYYAYETYDYVQHDNDFCMSCHLMEEPYERFAESAHRGLGCKACHQPNLVDRSTMALTQIIENPEEITVHAEVSNDRCAECHIQGNPEEWRLIANTAGHRVHLESDDPTLTGLQCVECHSTSVHEFAPIDRTCAQSGCHEDNTIELGGMSDLTIHCAACHTFVAPVDEEEGEERILSGVNASLLPDREECFTCHAMRTLVDMPDPDPHQGVCAACHNPHEQDTPGEATESCATAGCHTEVDTLSPFHRGMGPGVLEDCTNCHQAHDFSVETTNCLDCHQDVFRDESPDPVAAVAPDDELHASLAAAPVRFRPDLGAPVSVPPGPHPPTSDDVEIPVEEGWWSHPVQAQQETRFLHSQHRNVECGNCHTSQEVHGAVTVTSIADCRSCHHTEPVSRDCARCHAGDGGPAEAFSVVRSFDLSVGSEAPRTLEFEHENHAGLDCGECHTGGLALSAEGAQCASCHEDHHQADNDCASCHAQAPVTAHPPSEAHVTCSGAGCHEALPFEGVPRTRSACLVCHQDLREHRPGRECAECHTLPAARAGAPQERP